VNTYDNGSCGQVIAGFSIDVRRSFDRMAIPSENVDQVALRKWITAGLLISEVRGLNGDAGYLLSNMIAKYTLASSRYRLSSEALSWFDSRGIDLSKEYARSKYYGKNSPVMYEHSIPSSVVRSVLLAHDPSESSVKSVLDSAGEVVVVMRSEDERLGAIGLAKKMPDGWQYGDNPYARYAEAGIELSQSFMLVKGKIKR